MDWQKSPSFVILSTIPSGNESRSKFEANVILIFFYMGNETNYKPLNAFFSSIWRYLSLSARLLRSMTVDKKRMVSNAGKLVKMIMWIDETGSSYQQGQIEKWTLGQGMYLHNCWMGLRNFAVAQPR